MNDRQQSQRELAADLGLETGREDIKNARDGLRGVIGMQRRKNQVSGFGSGQRGRHGFAVAHLANQNHVRILPQDGANSLGKAGGIHAQFDLLDQRFLVRVLKLDWIFNRDDVIMSAAVDPLINAAIVDVLPHPVAPVSRMRPCRRSASTGERLRQIQRFQSGYFVGKKADGGCERTSLEVKIGAKSCGCSTNKAEIEAFALPQFLILVCRQERLEKAPDVLGCDVRAGNRFEGAIHSKRYGRTVYEDDVGAIGCNRKCQQLVERTRCIGI